jgi:hypothetical protein
VLNEYDELAGGVAGFHAGVSRADLIECVDVMDRDGETPGGDLRSERVFAAACGPPSGRKRGPYLWRSTSRVGAGTAFAAHGRVFCEERGSGNE